MLVRYRSEFRSSWACLNSEISFLFVIATVRPNIAINSFFQILRGNFTCRSEDLRYYPGLIPNVQEGVWHPHVMGQIMLLSLVTSHELSIVVPLVGRLALFGGGLSLGSSMQSSLLVWVRRVDFSGLFCWLSSFSSRFSPRPSR